MNKQEILKLVEAIHADQDIDKEMIFKGLEDAFIVAAKRHFALKTDPRVQIDRTTGELKIFDGDAPVDLSKMGRVAYQVARQLFAQKLRDAKNKSVFNEFLAKKRSIITGKVLRFDGENIICEIGRKVDAVLPKREQIQGETFQIGSKIRAYILDIDMRGESVVVILSRAHEDFVIKLFELEVPELRNGTCQIKGIARNPGYRTKMLVRSNNNNVDCLGACVGVRGSRIRTIVDELNGENIDVIKWSEDEVELVKNSLKPADVLEVAVDRMGKRHAIVYVDKNQLSLAIGKGGRNVRLASKLTGWEIDVYELQQADQASEQKP